MRLLGDNASFCSESSYRRAKREPQPKLQCQETVIEVFDVEKRLTSGELEEQLALLDSARSSLKFQRLGHTAVRSSSLCLLVDTKTYLQAMANTSNSRQSISAETFRQFDELKLRASNLLEYSKSRQSRLLYKASVLQSEIEVLLRVNRTGNLVSSQNASTSSGFRLKYLKSAVKRSPRPLRPATVLAPCLPTTFRSLSM